MTVYTIVVGCQGRGPSRYFPGVPGARGGFGRGGNGGPSDATSSVGGSAGGGGSAVLLGADVMLVGGGGGGTAFGGDPGGGGGTTGGAGGPTTDTGGGGGGGTATGPGAGGQVRAGTRGSAGTGHEGGSGSIAAGADNHGGGGGGSWFDGGGGRSRDEGNRRRWRRVRLRRAWPLRDADSGCAQRRRPGDGHPRGNLIRTGAASASGKARSTPTASSDSVGQRSRAIVAGRGERDEPDASRPHPRSARRPPAPADDVGLGARRGIQPKSLVTVMGDRGAVRLTHTRSGSWCSTTHPHRPALRGYTTIPLGPVGFHNPGHGL